MPAYACDLLNQVRRERDAIQRRRRSAEAVIRTFILGRSVAGRCRRPGKFPEHVCNKCTGCRSVPAARENNRTDSFIYFPRSREYISQNRKYGGQAGGGGGGGMREGVRRNALIL